MFGHRGTRTAWAVLAGIAAIAACVGEEPRLVPSAVDAGPSGDGSLASDAEPADATAPDAGGGPVAPTGKVRWLATIVPPPMSFVFPVGISVDAQDNVYVAGALTTGAAGSVTFDFGNGKTASVTPAASEEAFVAKYDATGACQWVTAISGAAAEMAYAVAIAPSGDVVVLGQTSSSTVTIDSTNASRPANAGGRDILLVKLNSSGKLVWHKIYGGPSTDEPGAVAVGPNGSIAVGGQFIRANGGDNIAFGPVSLSYPPSAGRVAGAVLLDQDGVGKWARSFPTAGAPVAGDRSMVRAIAFDTKNDVIVAGDFNSTIALRTGADTPINFTSRGDSDAWIAKLAGADGRTSWGQQVIGTSGQDRVSALATDGLDGVFASGTYMELDAGAAPTIGATSLPKFGGVDVFVTKLDKSGSAYEWARGFGGATLQVVNGMALDPWGNIVLAGRTLETMDFAGKKATGGGSDDGYVVKLDSTAAGAHWAHGLGSASKDDAFGVATSRTSGITAVTGTLNGPATLAGKDVSSAPDGGGLPYAYILVLDP